jgi:hypothetical protein
MYVGILCQGQVVPGVPEAACLPLSNHVHLAGQRAVLGLPCTGVPAQWCVTLAAPPVGCDAPLM